MTTDSTSITCRVTWENSCFGGPKFAKNTRYQISVKPIIGNNRNRDWQCFYGPAISGETLKREFSCPRPQEGGELEVFVRRKPKGSHAASASLQTFSLSQIKGGTGSSFPKHLEIHLLRGNTTPFFEDSIRVELKKGDFRTSCEKLTAMACSVTSVFSCCVGDKKKKE